MGNDRERRKDREIVRNQKGERQSGRKGSKIIRWRENEKEKVKERWWG